MSISGPSSIFEISSPLTSPSLAQENGSCVKCHSFQGGFSIYHKDISCTDCHRGNHNTSVKEKSHRNMVHSPGELNEALALCGKCHIEIVGRVLQSMMATGRGIIAGDKAFFQEELAPPP